MSASESNQRDYFRISCRAVISHCTVGAQVPGGKRPEAFFPDNEHFAMLRELRRMDQESQHLLAAIGEQDRTLGSYLHHLNRKLDTAVRFMATLVPSNSQGSEQTISLSEAGLAFHADPAPAVGSVLALRLTLLPAFAGLAVYGRVVKAGDESTDGTLVSVNFEHLQDAERQVLARHVMQVQMAEQRRKSGRV